MRRLMLIALLIAGPMVLAASGHAQAPPKRVALVIAVSAYQTMTALPGTPQDARLMGETLRALGFTLVTGAPLIDPDKRRMETALRDFGTAAEGAEMALFFYSGHGAQTDGVNWIIPPEANGGTRAAYELEMVDVGAVVRQIQAARPKLGIIILDACRNNPLRTGNTRNAGTEGYAAMRAPANMVLAYATQPGALSYDQGPQLGSRYTRLLAREMGRPGLDLFRVFNNAALATLGESDGIQQPWLALSPIDGDFFFLRGDVRPPVIAALPQAQQPAPAAQANADFVLVNQSGKPVRDLRAGLAGGFGDNRLTGAPLAPGARAGLQFPRGRGCAIDLQAVFGDGTMVQARGVETCRFDTMILDPRGRLLPANPSFRFVNGTTKPISDLRVSLANDTGWGINRLFETTLAPDARVVVDLPQGIACTVDLRVVHTDGTTTERRGLDTCALETWTLR